MKQSQIFLSQWHTSTNSEVKCLNEMTYGQTVKIASALICFSFKIYIYILINKFVTGKLINGVVGLLRTHCTS